jgi:signal transduction histidine kinase
VLPYSIFRTSSFRLALMYAALTGVSFIVLFAVIFLSTTRFMRHQIDDSVSSEIDEIFSDSQGRNIEAVRAVVEGLARHPSGFYYLLQDSQRTVQAGNLTALDPKAGILEFATRNSDGTSSMRGRGVELPDGYLFVGWSTHQLLDMEEMIIGSFAWGLAASIALALVGGLVMSGRLMHRIETVSVTSRNIIGEDLRQRLPVTQTDDELDHLAESVNAMLDRIQGLMSDLRQVTTDIAHDLRTPLTRLRHRLELANRPDGDTQWEPITLKSAIVEIDSILAIFSALLRISQIENGASRGGFKPVDLSELISTMAEVYRPMAEENAQTLKEEIDTSLVVNGDRELLMQLFANLLENGLKHTPGGSTIIIAAHRNGEHIEVSVIDNGQGIPAHLRDKVLQRFFRLESSRSTAGHGLGLSLASAIAKVHGTRIDLSDSAPGLAATVRFERAAA